MSEQAPHFEIGERLRKLRALTGLSQLEFAKKHGFGSTQYTNWEVGTRRITIDSAARLKERYGATLDYIYLGRIETLSQNLASSLEDISRA
jgi:transcriptional regulator with XRE-family HTH domain